MEAQKHRVQKEADKKYLFNFIDIYTLNKVIIHLIFLSPKGIPFHACLHCFFTHTLEKWKN